MEDFETRNGCKHTHTKLQSMSMRGQLHDLTLKYQALEQQYKTLQLESNEYKHHIADLEHQNEELKQEMVMYKQEVSDEQKLKPFVKHQMCSMRTSLQATDKEMTELKNKNCELVQLTDSLQSENNEIKKQNETLQVMVENNNKQKRISKQINGNTVNHNLRLQNENQLLRDELNIIKTIKLNSNVYIETPNQTAHGTNLSLSNNCSTKTNHTIRINFANTPHIKDDSLSFGKTYHGGFLSTDSIPYSVFHAAAGSESMISAASAASDEFEQQNEDLKVRLKRLETQNAELLLKVYSLEKEKQENTETDESDAEEMEELFHKCDKEIQKMNCLVSKHKKLYCKFQTSRFLFGL